MEQRFAIFDMDGTLVDSMLYWHNLGQEYLESKGVTGDLNEVLERSKPMTMVESGALFIREFGLAGTPESVAAEINAVMEKVLKALKTHTILLTWDPAHTGSTSRFLSEEVCTHADLNKLTAQDGKLLKRLTYTTN